MEHKTSLLPFWLELFPLKRRAQLVSSFWLPWHPWRTDSYSASVLSFPITVYVFFSFFYLHEPRSRLSSFSSPFLFLGGHVVLFREEALSSLVLLFTVISMYSLFNGYICLSCFFVCVCRRYVLENSIYTYITPSCEWLTPVAAL